MTTTNYDKLADKKSPKNATTKSKSHKPSFYNP